MFGINLSIVLLITSVVAMGACHKLPDTPHAKPSGISHSDSDIMAVVEQLKVKIINMEEHYDDTVNEMKKNYDGEIQDMKKHYDGEIQELKNTQTTKLSYNAVIKELKERHDEMRSSFDEMKSSHDELKSSLDEMKLMHVVEILELKESYHVIKMKYDQITKGKDIHIKTIINQTDDILYPNYLYKDRVDKSRNKSELKASPQTEITSPQQKSDLSVDSTKGRNKKENPALTTNTESEQLKQRLEMSGHNVLDLSDDDLNTVEGQAAGFSAFQAYMSTDHIGSPDDILVHDDVRINIGGGYDAVLGIFPAPTAGIYVINRSHMADNSCGTINAYTRLMVNGAHISTTSSEYVTSTANTELLQLVAGDDIWLQTYPSGCHSFIGGNYGSFSGYLLIENI